MPKYFDENTCNKKPVCKKDDKYAFGRCTTESSEEWLDNNKKPINAKLYPYNHIDDLINEKLEQHIQRTDNPHIVTLQQLNADKLFVHSIRIEESPDLKSLTMTLLDLNGNPIEHIPPITIDVTANIVSKTTAEWEAEGNPVTVKNKIYVYTDGFTYDEVDPETGEIIKVYVPKLKIGDGNAYLNDMRFVGDDVMYYLLKHIEDATRHITQQERERWNNKLNYELNPEDEVLIFNRD